MSQTNIIRLKPGHFYICLRQYILQISTKTVGGRCMTAVCAVFQKLQHNDEQANDTINKIQPL